MSSAESVPPIPLIRDRERLAARLAEIPPEPGVYFMRDGSDRLLYIGKSKKLRTRVRSYFRPFQNQSGRAPIAQLHSPRIEVMVRQVTDIEFIVTDSESEALALEANLIKQHQPHFNVLLKDDKKYPYLCITWSEPYPRIFITRKRRLGNRRDRYYGPYTNAGLLRSTLGLVKRIFPLRQRPKPLFKDRPCLNYDIGRCPGVCQGLISPEDYRATVQKVAMVFQGRTDELIAALNEQMERAAAELNFEYAAQLRDRVRGLERLEMDQKVSLPDDTVSRDAIALAADEARACVQLFQIRAGRLVGRLGFVAEVPALAIAATETPQPSAQGEALIPQPLLPQGEEALIPQPLLPQGEGEIESPSPSGRGVGERADREFGAILQRVLEEHYAGVEDVEIPSEVLVQFPLPDPDWLATWLSDRRGRKVAIVAPQRQAKAELVDLVERNAEYELARTRRFADRNLQAMQDLAELLDLPDLPHWIEGFDISHVQGSDAVASRVVFADGLPAKQHYRHYKIRNPEVRSGRSDDFASMAEVVRRRFRDGKPRNAASPALEMLHQGSGGRGRSSDAAPWPDVVMVDGGKGQLSAAVAVLRELDLLGEVQILGLAKQREEIFLPGESEPLAADPDRPGVQLLRRLRDEAHRFAVSFHRQKRTDRMRRSRLEAIPGLGHHRQKQLLAHFRSIDYIREASPEKLTEVPGIGPQLARQIYEYFHPQSPSS